MRRHEPLHSLELPGAPDPGSDAMVRRTAQDAKTTTCPLLHAQRTFPRNTNFPPPKGYIHVLISPGEISPKVFLHAAQARLRPPPESPFHNKNPSPGYAGTSHAPARGKTRALSVDSAQERERVCRELARGWGCPSPNSPFLLGSGMRRAAIISPRRAYIGRSSVMIPVKCHRLNITLNTKA